MPRAAAAPTSWQPVLKTTWSFDRRAMRQLGAVMCLLALGHFGSFFLGHGANYSGAGASPVLQGELVAMPRVHKGRTLHGFGLRTERGTTTLDCNVPAHDDCFPGIAQHHGRRVFVEFAPKLLAGEVVASVRDESGHPLIEARDFESRTHRLFKAYLVADLALAFIGMGLVVGGRRPPRQAPSPESLS